MSSHPINLAVRFLLELAALFAMAFWGFQHGTGTLHYVLAPAVPLIAATLWGTLAVPGDPSRSGSAPLAVPGVFRLGLEVAFFAFATWGLFDAARNELAIVLGVAVVVHYAVSYDRIGWLLRA